MSGRVTYLAVAIGGACGALAALVAPSPHAPAASAATRVPTPSAALGRAPKPEPVLAVSTDTRAVSPVPSLDPSLPASASASAVPATSPSAAPSASAGLGALAELSGEAAPLPNSEAALLRAEMHCDQKDTQACIVAARSYETGSVGPRDPEKGVKYRKIALTLWMSLCDHNSATACATLWDMYRAGRGVPQSERNASALLQRTRELCHYNDAPVCHDLPTAH